MSKTVTDFLGRPLAVTAKDKEETKVSDWIGRSKGSADTKGTKDFIGRSLSPNNVPDILIGREDTP